MVKNELMSSHRPSDGVDGRSLKNKDSIQQKIKYKLVNNKGLFGKALDKTNIRYNEDKLNNLYKKVIPSLKSKRRSCNSTKPNIKREYRRSSVDTLLNKALSPLIKDNTSRSKRIQIDKILEGILKQTKKTNRNHSIIKGNYNIINVSIHHNVNNIYHKRKGSFVKNSKLDFSKPRTSFEKGGKLSETRIEETNDDFIKERLKIIKDNKEWFRNHKEPPVTTLEHYHFVRLIGKGAFGKVILGIHILTGKYVAIKTIDKKYMKDKFSRHKVFQEVYILKKVRHSNVIRLLEVFEDSDRMLIVMEYAAGGDLLQYVRTKGPLEESKARIVFRQIVYGLGHVHARGVLHRDIKLDNILLDVKGNVKICDFGVSRIINNDDPIKEQCGTPAYIAPEVITNEGYKGFYIDHWSLGVLLYAMITAKVPFHASNMQELLEVIMKKKLRFSLTVSKLVVDLIESLLKINPVERLSIPEILEHPWMKKEIEEFYKSSYNDYITAKDCEAYKESFLGLDQVDMSKLFFRERKMEKLSYVDYCIIENDLHTYRIDEDVLDVISEFGYPRKLIIEGLEKKLLNHATATYNLLVLA